LLPASAFEKFLSQFLIRFVGGIIVFLALFWIDARLAQWTLMQTEDVQSGKAIVATFKYSIFWEGSNQKEFPLLLFAACLTIGIFLFSVRLFFRRFALIKSAVVAVVLILLILSAMVVFSHIFYPEKTIGWDVQIPNYIVFGNTYNTQLYLKSIFYVAWLFILPLGYFKLKEKQV
jgi:hypothetical protein